MVTKGERKGGGINQEFGISRYKLLYIKKTIRCLLGSPGGSDCKASACNVGDPGLSPGSGRTPGEGNGNQLQYSCLENCMDVGAW